MRNKYTYDFVKKVFEEEGYSLISKEYKSHQSNLETICPNGHKYTTTLYRFYKQKCRCSTCVGNKRYTLEFVKNYIESENGYQLLSTNYKNQKQKLKIKCNNNHIYYSTFSNFKNNGHRCYECSPTKKLSYQYVKGYIESFNYKLLSNDYINNSQKMILKCPNGHIFKIRFNHFKFDQGRCPKCKKSKGEDKIKEFLIKQKIKFKQEYRFKDCKYKRQLPFDFVVFDNSNKILFAIEYDGQQHFKPIETFGGKEEFLETKKRDKIKNNYCKKNGIPLLRIPFFKFNQIDIILDNYLNEIAKNKDLINERM